MGGVALGGIICTFVGGYNGKYAFQSQEYNWMENYDNWS